MEYLELLRNLLKAEYVVHAGYVLMTLVIFTETGLLIGFCLPGDSLLVTAGMLAASPDFNISIVILNLCLVPAAILGDTVGYWIGYYSGPRMFTRKKSLFFNPEHLEAAQAFYERHGGKTIILARFMPIVRTFAPVVAGMGRMNYKTFLFYNVIGGVAWVTGLTSLAFFIGNLFPELVKRLELIIIFVVLLSISPGIFAFLKRWRQGKPETLAEALAAPDGGDPIPHGHGYENGNGNGNGNGIAEPLANAGNRDQAVSP